MFKNEKFLYFAAGLAAAALGATAVKSGKARKWCVQGMASGILLQRQALEAFQNIKDEATDICHDASR